MKRVVVLLIAVLYLAVSSGFTIHTHYCMGKVVGVSLTEPSKDADRCDLCGMVKKPAGKKGCCHDEHKVVKSSSDQQIAKYFSFQATDLFATTRPEYGVAQKGGPVVAALQAAAPTHGPPLRGCPVYILYRNIRV